MSKYTIEFELPDNDTVLSRIGAARVNWSVWGYSGIAKAKPSVDVVLCKDCKYCKTYYHTYSDIPHRCLQTLREVKSNDFCSLGEVIAMRLETAIKRLIDNVRLAESNDFIKDKVAWALYLTWKEADKARYNKGLEEADKQYCNGYNQGRFDEAVDSETVCPHSDECMNTDCGWR